MTQVALIWRGRYSDAVAVRHSIVRGSPCGRVSLVRGVSRGPVSIVAAPDPALHPRAVIAIVGAGSNLGTRVALLRGAARRLDGLGVRVERVARFVATPALVLPGAPPGPDFVNTAFRVRFDGAPEALLDRLLRVERELGRVRTERWGARTLDLDLLWTERPFRSARLVVPHPALELRDFALAPLLDVAPELQARYRRFLRRPPRRAELDALDRRMLPPKHAIRRVETHDAATIDDALAVLTKTPGALLSLDPVRYVLFGA